jgi:hypothetical protein
MMSGRRTQLLFAGAAGLVLLYLVVTHTLAAVFATANPQLALRLQPRQPTALLRLSDAALVGEINRTRDTPPPPAAGESAQAQALLQAQARAQNPAQAPPPSPTQASEQDDAAGSGAPPPDPPARPPATPPAVDLDPDVAQKVHAWAARALLADPLNAHAMQLLGQVARKDDVARYMEAAVRRSKRESGAVYWLVRKYTEDRNYEAALRQADILLRTREGMFPLVLPTLAAAVEDPKSRTALQDVLLAKPRWREGFFEEVPGRLADPAVLLQVLLDLRTTAAPPSRAERARFMSYLMRAQNYELAYYTWLQFLDPEALRNAGLLYNGSFEATPYGYPFDWDARAGQGVTVDLARALETGEHALYLEFGSGRVEFNGVSQIVMLPPGDYTLAGKYRGSLSGRRGLVWSIRCLQGDKSLLKTPMMLGDVPDWTRMEDRFTVPAEACQAQSVQLDLDARSASEQLVSGSVYYDDLQIARAQPDIAEEPTPPVSAKKAAPADEEASHPGFSAPSFSGTAIPGALPATGPSAEAKTVPKAGGPQPVQKAVPRSAPLPVPLPVPKAQAPAPPAPTVPALPDEVP